jgi:hypothetical protein
MSYGCKATDDAACQVFAAPGALWVQAGSNSRTALMNGLIETGFDR